MRGRDGKISADACVKGQWGTQVKVHHLLLKSKFRTSNKKEADLFFVPSYVKCVRMMGGLNDKEINQTYVKVLSQMPYFRLSGGRNHVFVFPSGAGAHLFRSWATFLNRSIILTPEGDRTDKRDVSSFNTWKDIIIPGNVDDGMTTFYGSTIVQPVPLSKRKYLANFLGRAQGKVGRLQLVELAKQYPDKECVPVILSDQVELPFQDVIDYSQISIKWPSSRLGPQLLEYLESIPDEVIEGMIARGRRMRCLLVYAPETEPCSAMLGILWELQRKVRLFHQSAETFWLHNGSIVNRDLVEFDTWRTPVPLP
ncbi:probable glucuronoxylan glucuronosyltransferase F8H isoform X2 [Asparagus officinalis]|uniref:probable glucuronoxylan glucuronosyltransferase F8H isoform X2 n=1 Tax=Asparagus officinalis TaxID=4686 RepID=UPI00098E265B|nr:probable glucuronoxylan glucuronosyltransferase F8H isoform X2 [Asparagus officinalis]